MKYIYLLLFAYFSAYSMESQKTLDHIASVCVLAERMPSDSTGTPILPTVKEILKIEFSVLAAPKLMPCPPVINVPKTPLRSSMTALGTPIQKSKVDRKEKQKKIRGAKPRPGLPHSCVFNIYDQASPSSFTPEDFFQGASVKGLAARVKGHKQIDK